MILIHFYKLVFIVNVKPLKNIKFVMFEQELIIAMILVNGINS